MTEQEKLHILDVSSNKLKSIVSNCKIQKLANVALWEDFQSKSFTYENGRNSPKFNAYKRGTIVFVNFGTSIGTELCGNHFAIVLNKNDNPFNGSLSVVPLTSKNKNYNLPLDKELISRIIDNIISEGIKIGLISKNIKSSIYGKNERVDGDIITLFDESLISYIKKYSNKVADSSGLVQFKENEILEILETNLKLLEEISKFYKKNDLDSYAMMDSITTVSKYRIKKPINRMDPIGSVRVSNNILEKIDFEIIKRFTK